MIPKTGPKKIHNHRYRPREGTPKTDTNRDELSILGVVVGGGTNF